MLLAVALVYGASCSHAQSPGEASAAKSQAQYRIEQVQRGVYRFVAGHYRSVFLVTDRSIVVTDPIDAQAAEWLKAELARRFEQPVRYVIYSHSHTDHTYGGQVFAEPGVTFISHRLARRALVRTRAKTHLPDIVFDESMTLHVDGRQVALEYHGPNNGRGSISMYFEEADVMFVVDWIVVGRLPYKDLPGYDLPGMLDSTREILERDFEVFVGGHADIGTKADVRRYLSYLEALHDGVLEGMQAGRSLAAIKREVDLSEYADLKMFEEWRGLNIEGVYRALRDDSYLLRRPDVRQPESAD